MAPPRRFFVRSADGRGIAGYDSRETAEFVALEYGEGAHVIDTEAPVYTPMLQEVARRKLAYLPYGAWGAGRFGIDDDLIEAIKKRHVAVVHAFLAKGADPNARDKGGLPALNWAAAKAGAEVVELLLANGADPNGRDDDGATAADVAEQKGRGEIAALLKRREFQA